MAKYTITAPDGGSYDVTAPDSASQDEVLAYAKANYSKAPKRSKLSTGLQVADNIFNALPDSPATRIQNALKTLGGNIAEKGGQMGYPKTGVALGAIPTFAPEALSFLSPETGTSKLTALKPNIPAVRQEAVNAANELKIPLTRAEQTGSMLGSGLESMLEKTPFGAKPIQQFRGQQAEAMEAAKSGLQGNLGTQADSFSVGQKALGGLKSRAKNLQGVKNSMFEAIPENVNVPLNESRKMADTIIQEQSQFLPETRNGDVSSLARAIQDAEKGTSSGEGVTGGPETKGITQRIAGGEIPPSSRTIQSSLTDAQGKPLSYQQAIPGRKIPDQTIFGAKTSVSPEQKFAAKPNYPMLKRLREVLNARIQANNAGVSSGLPGQANSVARDYVRLKSALDKDIENYVASQKTPLGSMMGKEFASSYKKANAFSGAYSKLFKGDDAMALAETPPEKIVDTIFKKNNETAIKRFRAQVGEDGFTPAKQKFTQELLESKNVAGELKKYNPGTLSAIYSQPELNQIKKYGLAQMLSRGAEKVAGNPSGTGRQVTSAGSFGGAGAALATGHPIAAGAILGGPYAAAKTYLSNAARSGVTFNPQVQRIIRALLQASRRSADQNANLNP